MRAPRRDQAAMCQGKVSHSTYREACSQRRHYKHLDIYRCPHCGQFHLGNKPKGMGRPKPPPPAIELEF